MGIRGLTCAVWFCVLGCQGIDPIPPRAGGDTTIDDRSSNAFRTPAPNLDAEARAKHLEGDVAFEATFVTGNAPVNGGLGPIFNNTSCAGCHNRDGRGLPVVSGGPTSQSLVRVSLPAGEPAVPGGAVPLPGLGTQLQDHAVFGVAPEAHVALEWIEAPGQYGDGTTYSLRKPALQITLANGVALASDVLTSLRMPPAVFGLGLLEAIADDTIASVADPDDLDGDGISGRVNQVWDVHALALRVGRFGVKANTPFLPQQAAAAYVNDMGISNPTFPIGDEPNDIDAHTLEIAAFYTQTLAVPGRAEMDDESRHGEVLFDEFGCTGCHLAETTTGPSPIAALANQAIAPFTDLLIHDLGDGLSDGRSDFAASGREWRTSPLWGLGLVQTVLPGASYLHDGRARTLAEAILWHGGEADAAREAFRTAALADRAALLAFLLVL